ALAGAAGAAVGRQLLDTATSRFEAAGCEWDDERERIGALQRHLTQVVDPLGAALDGRLDELGNQSAEQLLQLVRVIDRTVASAEGQAEVREAVRRLQASLRDLVGRVPVLSVAFADGTDLMILTARARSGRTADEIEKEVAKAS